MNTWRDMFFIIAKRDLLVTSSRGGKDSSLLPTACTSAVILRHVVLVELSPWLSFVLVVWIYFALRNLVFVKQLLSLKGMMWYDLLEVGCMNNMFL